ncbi:DUF4276 family protein [Leptolyngbya sp. PCC 6406]|uniref:DUF4276 family protein n=1 Tax=Leptolyngbya sp. PCC 6406 TaxID=1173264 RepID=UPI0002AC5FE6|nr:AAA family ATPase [Leptolyngbya sp. PCC 6406]
MKIEGLRLKNFKVFQSVEVKDLPQFCVFVGHNGTGKSTIFSVFEFLKEAMASNVNAALGRLGGSRGLAEVRGQKGLVRIACRELESFYLGDLPAVATAMEMPQLVKQQVSSKFRIPDDLNNAKQELKKLTRNRYQEVASSRAIAPFLNLDLDASRNCSRSFCHLIWGIDQILAIEV